VTYKTSEQTIIFSIFGLHNLYRAGPLLIAEEIWEAQTMVLSELVALLLIADVAQELSGGKSMLADDPTRVAARWPLFLIQHRVFKMLISEVRVPFKV